MTPNEGSVHEESDVNGGKKLKKVPIKTPTIKGQNRLINTPNLGPMQSCQILVTNEGIISKLAAIIGSMVILSNPMAMVGSPKPITPLMNPANKKTPITISIIFSTSY